MQATLDKIANAPWFVNFITIAILMAGVLVGFETYPSMVERYGSTLHLLNSVILWIFVAEIIVKMGAQGSRPWRYFHDAWNVFDFIIVAAAFLPFDSGAVTVLRLFRLLRVLKLVRALPKLQILVGALLKSIPSMAYVSILLLLLFYIYAVAAVFFFSVNDPLHFGDLQTSMLSLFRVVTLEDWTDIMYINMYGCSEYGYGPDSVVPCTNSQPHMVLSACFFVSFVLIGTMIILNLFIGVIMNGMEEAQAEAAELERAERKGDETPVDDIISAQEQLKVLQEPLRALQQRLQHQSPPHR